jgi:hypothetical protein
LLYELCYALARGGFPRELLKKYGTCRCPHSSHVAAQARIGRQTNLRREALEASPMAGQGECLSPRRFHEYDYGAARLVEIRWHAIWRVVPKKISCLMIYITFRPPGLLLHPMSSTAWVTFSFGSCDTMNTLDTDERTVCGVACVSTITGADPLTGSRRSPRHTLWFHFQSCCPHRSASGAVMRAHGECHDHGQ